MNRGFSLRLQGEGFTDDYVHALYEAFGRKLRERGCTLAETGYPIHVSLVHGSPEGTYCLQTDRASAKIEASDLCAVWAGLGEFLLGWHFDSARKNDDMIPERKVTFTPKRRYRGLYFATHFHNFYHTAPIEQVLMQVEDAAFRGGNAIAVWYDMHHFTSFEQQESLALVQRLKAILQYAKRIGMKICMNMLSNEAFMGTPPALRASSAPQNGYHAVLDGHYGVEICPSKPGGIAEIMRQREIVLQGFDDVRPDYVIYWPYDQGGCTCKDCAPWGTNGFLRLYPHFEELIHRLWPNTHIIMSTWYFDLFIDGEWEKFYQLAESGCIDTVDYLMDFFPRGKVPACIAEKGLPAGKRMLAFPEISMYGGKPWGGFGANPLPAFLQESNDRCLSLYSGESCYSEGIFEDINKTIMLLTYAGREEDTRKAIADYAAWEWMMEDAEQAILLCEILEETLPRTPVETETEIRYEIIKPERIQQAADLARKINETMAEPAKDSWRWRIVYLRALIDEQLQKDSWRITEACDGYLHELESYYHIVPQSLPAVSPPTTTLIRKMLQKKHPQWLSAEENGEETR